MKKSTIKNHRKLWQGIVEYLEKGRDIKIGAGMIKDKVFEELFPKMRRGRWDDFILHNCWFCEEGFRQEEIEPYHLLCNCPLLSDGKCKLWDEFCDEVNFGDIKQAISIAKQIRDIQT